MIIEVHADIVMECRGIYYVYETRGVWGHAPPGKIRVFRWDNVAFEAILDHSRPIFTLK